MRRILLAPLLLFTFCLAAQAQSNWTFMADMLVGRGGTASAIIGSRIYLLGGNLGATVVTRMDTYDIPANT